MSKLNLTAEQAEELFMNDGNDELVLVDSGEWEQDGKYQNCYFIYKHNETGEHFRMWIGRSGSYHTDWDYNFYDTQLTKVREEEVVTTVWKAVK